MGVFHKKNFNAHWDLNRRLFALHVAVLTQQPSLNPRILGNEMTVTPSQSTKTLSHSSYSGYLQSFGEDCKYLFDV